MEQWGSVLGLLKLAGQSERRAVVELASEGMTQTDVDRETYENSDVFPLGNSSKYQVHHTKAE